MRFCITAILITLLTVGCIISEDKSNSSTNLDCDATDIYCAPDFVGKWEERQASPHDSTYTFFEFKPDNSLNYYQLIYENTHGDWVLEFDTREPSLIPESRYTSYNYKNNLMTLYKTQTNSTTIVGENHMTILSLVKDSMYYKDVSRCFRSNNTTIIGTWTSCSNSDFTMVYTDSTETLKYRLDNSENVKSIKINKNHIEYQNYFVSDSLMRLRFEIVDNHLLIYQYETIKSLVKIQ